MPTVEELQARIREFNRARDWGQYHSPKNLAVALSVECAELLEIFLWMTPEQSTQLDDKQAARLREEIGDILIYLLNLASKFDLDPLQCAAEKLEVNERKYPAEQVRGSSRKYDEY
jgi:dCTP diphosphatase